MSDRIHVAVEGPVVRVTLRGKTTLMLSIEAVLRAVWNARQSGARGVLFDIRDATSEDFKTRILKQADQAPRTGIAGYRIAVVALTGDPRIGYIEDVGTSRGYDVKCFTDLAQAREWLAPGSPAPDPAASP
jgi:hypothetical protein